MLDCVNIFGSHKLYCRLVPISKAKTCFCFVVVKPKIGLVCLIEVDDDAVLWQENMATAEHTK